jgi:hypothetical protein
LQLNKRITMHTPFATQTMSNVSLVFTVLNEAGTVEQTMPDDAVIVDRGSYL